MNSSHPPIALINKFPDFSAPGFNMEAYNNSFKTSNIIINAKATQVAYTEHWGCFSVKCAFNGEEIYQLQNRVYSVNEKKFLLLNEGQNYSSYILSETPVESFTLNFTPGFIGEVKDAAILSVKKNLDHDAVSQNGETAFVEKLYLHNNAISPLIMRIKCLTNNFNENKERIMELYYQLMHKIFQLDKEVSNEINSVKACKNSTRRELYKRLHYAKDYIDSCYTSEITLHQLSQVTLMNSAYFLRQFKKHFGTTPYQYLMQKRMCAALDMIHKTEMPVVDVCNAVGYEDVSSFAKLFKKYHGISPERYRNHILKKSVFTFTIFS